MKLVHCKKDQFDIYIGRPSKWGNPFSHENNTLAKFKVASREEAIAKYAQWIIKQENLLKDLTELKDKILGCWCYPKPCHGEVLIYLIDKLKI